jgi:hypothetical protein
MARFNPTVSVTILHQAFTDKELSEAWDLVTAGIGYTEAEVSRLDPQRQRIARLVNALRRWRARLRVSDEAQAAHEELKARIRQRRQVFREFEQMVRICMLLHPECVPENIRELVLLRPRGWQAIIAESKRQGKGGRGRQGTKGSLRHAVERICAITKANTLHDLLDAIEEGEDLLPDMFNSLKDPIHITDVQIDHKKREMRYRNRKQSPTEEPKKVSFDRLGNILLEISKINR